MLKHKNIWTALDRLAIRHGISPSAMARMAGLDPTTFNKSKRLGPDGKPRWPSTESIAKVLTALGVGFGDFAHIVENMAQADNGLNTGGISIPLINMSRANKNKMLDSNGRPIAGNWDEIKFPGSFGGNIFAVQINDAIADGFLQSGDKIIIAPEANIKCGDLVLVKPKRKNLLIGTLTNLSATKIIIDMKAQKTKPGDIYLSDIKWVSKIIWISR